MTAYICTLSGTLSNGVSVSVDLDGTWEEGGGPHFSGADEDTVMQAPIDENGEHQDQPMELKYSTTRILITGRFMDGWGSLNWVSPTTKAEKLIALQRLGIIDPDNAGCLTLTWPVATKTMKCKFDRWDIYELAAHGNTIAYDFSLQITKG